MDELEKGWYDPSSQASVDAYNRKLENLKKWGKEIDERKEKIDRFHIYLSIWLYNCFMYYYLNTDVCTISQKKGREIQTPNRPELVASSSMPATPATQ